MKTPANSTLDAGTNRYEDFVATHIAQADEVHFAVRTGSPPGHVGG